MSIEQVKLPEISSVEDVTRAASKKLNEALKEASDNKVPVLLLLSGGSALALLENVNPDSITSNTTVGVLDERYSANPAENNFAQIASTSFYQKAKERKAQFIDTRVKTDESQVQLAARFNEELLKWMRNNPSGTIIATVGMGPDGHTSGMMPFPEDPARFAKLFDNGDEKMFVTSYDATGKSPYPLRVTTNMNFLRKINTAIVYVVKEDKRPALEKLMASTGSMAETPARILNDITGKVYLFTDL